MSPGETIPDRETVGGLIVRTMRAADYGRVAELWEYTGCEIRSGADDLAAIAMFLGQNPELSVVAESGRRIVGALLCGEDGRAGFIHRLTLEDSKIAAEAADAMVRRCLLRLRALGLTRCFLICEETCLSVAIGRGASLGLGKAVATISERALAATRQRPEPPERVRAAGAAVTSVRSRK